MTLRTAPEQPQDWTEPGAHPVAPGVHRIPVPLPSVGLRAVNVYAIEDRDGLALIDSGWALPAGERALVAGLRRLGHRPSDVTRVFVTHAHHDHYTQALALRSSHGTRVFLGRGEAASVDAYARTAEIPAPQPALLRRAGAPELAEAMEILVKEQQAAESSPWGAPDRWLDDGDRIEVAGRDLEVLATPGHTRGHVVLRDVEVGALFAGDHVLPHITPSIGYERAPEPFPLRSYLTSLRLVRGLPDALLFPAHGPVTASVHTRVDELLVHHEQRLAVAAAAVRAGAGTAHAVASAMPWTRRAQRIDQLETEHAALAVLEIDAHLDVLIGAGELVAADVGGVRHVAVA